MKTLLRVAALALLGCMLTSMALAAEFKRITKEEAKPMVEAGKVVVIDSRSMPDWNGSDKKLPGAVRGEADKVKVWSATLDKAKTILVYCA